MGTPKYMAIATMEVEVEGCDFMEAENKLLSEIDLIEDSKRHIYIGTLPPIPEFSDGGGI